MERNITPLRGAWPSCRWNRTIAGAEKVAPPPSRVWSIFGLGTSILLRLVCGLSRLDSSALAAKEAPKQCFCYSWKTGSYSIRSRRHGANEPDSRCLIVTITC